MTDGRWRLTSHFATYDSTSPEYAIVRLAAFGVLAVVCLVLGVIVTPGLGVLGAFCLLAAILWWRRWRRACEDDEVARG